MSKYTKEEQLKIVGWAISLESAIESEKAQLSTLRAMQFKAVPAEPKEPAAVVPQYPPQPKADFAYYLENSDSKIAKLLLKLKATNIGRALIIWIILGVIASVFALIPYIGPLISTLAILAIILFWVFLIKEYLAFNKKRAELSMKIAENTPEYVEACKKADEAAKAEQTQRNSEYALAKENYETKIIPEYNRELEHWTSSQQMKINIISDDLDANIQYQQELYNQTKLIPVSNRSLNDLTWLYYDMNSSEHDFERAIDMLNANKQLSKSEDIEKSINRMHGNVVKAIDNVFVAVESGNDISEEINEKLGKTRRDMNIGNIVATVQRHNINKKL